MTYTCRICAKKDRHETFVFRERMFGWGDEFAYFQCNQCGCLQIGEVPGDLSRFYPPYYYSFHLQPLPQAGWKARLAARRDAAIATNHGWGGKLLSRIQPARVDVQCLGRVPLRKDMRILDVGCGRGQLLSILRRAGFSYLLGVDPYLPAEVEAVSGLRVLRRPLQEVEERFDCIMLHHVFEHIENGLEMLTTCRNRLLPEGRILLRVPTVECAAWERYREHWVALDVPRHLLLHTRTSIQLLARQAGLEVLQCWCDSTAFQFIASELYLKGLPLADAQGHATPFGQVLTAEQIKQFEHEARALNKTNRGDQLVVLLSATALERSS